MAAALRVLEQPHAIHSQSLLSSKEASVSRTFGECADGQMTAHGMRGNSEIAFTPDTSQGEFFLLYGGTKI